MSKLHRLAGAAAASAIMIGTLGASPAAAVTQPEPPVAIQGACSGTAIDRVSVIVDKGYIRSGYYKSYPVVKTVSRGASLAFFEGIRNRYGNEWFKVQYSDRTNDWCGWIYTGSVWWED
ncbi:hypothetical protein IM697_01805 [Streptomyces ferrugineus]|uniref:SH3b domain-containing protein n=1 Tax=Streptomyces ferrugineus TaxID=1413221 RepID=A0A7M2SNG8_9ACTN|nr:hypothetical protein [Streptomyces ferrugineus]QOV37225.1 hypothetical protein IM697_01805 [Streptomyces ferrugineus]